ncbi:hypothetical protein HPB50_011759 [Hyalomma asiaticum]|uniref:Uncharacterized protein n=1 Tax=Hyalomma asiaticum TaxID=266040 RepID=A0ACB7TIR7_HYAAI|nr:hypothetical protein HPB50_011759 [Hyalomma asiaticum]
MRSDNLQPGELQRILADELDADAAFLEAWTEAERFYENTQDPLSPLWNFMPKENYLAIICYTLDRPNICLRFNAACRSARPTEQSWRAFGFKSLWSLLVAAFRCLPPFHNVPVELYRGVSDFCVSGLVPVPFPHFVSASLCGYQASKFGRQRHLLVLLHVPPEFVRDISPYAVYPHHAEVLIWPLCSFTCMTYFGGYREYFQFRCAFPVYDPPVWEPWQLCGNRPAPWMVAWGWPRGPRGRPRRPLATLQQFCMVIAGTCGTTSPRPDADCPREVVLSEETLAEIKKSRVERLAETKKEEGNELYGLQKYDEAVKRYTEAIELDGSNIAYYSNRAACYMMLGNHRAALDDCHQALQRDPHNAKSLLREAKCYVALGDPAAALRSLHLLRDLDPQNPALPRELKSAEILQHFLDEGDKAYEAQNYEKVIYCMDRALQQAVSCSKIEVLRAESLALLKRLTDARQIANNIMRAEPTNADAMYVRGLCFYYEDNIDKALQHFQQVLRLAPDHPKASAAYKKARLLKSKKDEGNEAFNKGNYQEAFNIYTSALEVDPSNKLANSKLYFNRATVCSKINKLNQTVEDCTTAISLNEDYLKAYMRRAKTYMDLEMYEEAVRDYERILRKEHTRENKRLLDQAKLELKKSKRKDYYKVLGISKDATVDDIKKAYRKRALLHHPDRHSNASEDMKREQEKKFKELGEAYNILSDPKKRMRYDEGRDLEDMDSFSSDASPHVFRTFFEAPGFFSAGGSSFQHDAGFGFPGGFSFQFG